MVERVVAGIHVVHPPVEQIEERIDEGYRSIAYSTDTILLNTSCREAISKPKQFNRQ